MEAYKKYAIAVQIIAVLVILLDAVLTTLHWFFPLAYKAIGINIIREYDVSSLSFWQIVSGFIVEGIASALLAYGFLLVIRLMSYIKNNQYFTLEIIKLLRCITQVSLIYVIYNVVCGMMLSAITSLHKGPGERIVSLSVGTQDLINILAFCFMFLMMTIIQKGYELKHEQELTI